MQRHGKTHLLVELHGLVCAALPHAVAALGQHPHAAAQPLGPAGHAEHAQAQRAALRRLDHGRRRLVVLDRNAVDLHDIVPDLQAAAAGGAAGRALLHHKGAVAHDGEAEATVGAGGDVDLIDGGGDANSRGGK